MANEKRLIDANALRVQFDDIPPFIGVTGGCVQQAIDKAPTVDAVEVVRCKDCKHRVVGWNNGAYHCGNPCYGMASGVELKDDDFCSYGERREGE